MKPLLGLGLAFLASIGLLAGCKPTSEAGGEPKKDALLVGVVYDQGGLGDKSFNDSAQRGVEMAEKKFGITARGIESKEVRDYEANLRELAELGCGLIIGVGSDMEEYVARVAKEFPDVKFALVDGTVEAANLRSLVFKEEEGSFLVGYLAGLMTKTNKIGFVGGKKLPVIERFQYGYYAGAQLANPSIEILPAKFTDDWNNADVAKIAAGFLYSDGADVVFHAAGRAGLGVIDAAKENKKFAIGVDSDQDGIAPGYVLTSMIKRVDNAVYQTISDAVSGKFSGGIKVYGLASDGVGYSDLTHTKDIIGIDNIERLERVKQDIVDGKVTVPSTPEEWAKLQAAKPK